MLYNGDYHILQFCNGTNWYAFGLNGTVASGGAGCSSPTGKEGDQIYNSDHHPTSSATAPTGLRWAGAVVVDLIPQIKVLWNYMLLSSAELVP
jgi:hypothetical protein